jgi:RNA polymerase sigma-70 factor (ECF subfamily)
MEQEMLWETPIPNQAAVHETGSQQAPGAGCEPGLVRAAQRGSLAAFNQLVLAHQNSLYGWVASLVRDDSLADDITQLTFLTAYEKLATFRGGSLRAWLFTIARNRSLDELRIRKRHPNLSLEGSMQDEDEPGLLSFLPADTLSPEDSFIQAERAQWLQGLLNGLPEPLQQVLTLVDVHELDYQEAAQILSLPLGTLKSRVARARLKLRERIAESGDW